MAMMLKLHLQERKERPTFHKICEKLNTEIQASKRWFVKNYSMSWSMIYKENKRKMERCNQKILFFVTLICQL